jgi:hypothetical protein
MFRPNTGHFRFHLEKLFCETVIQLCKRALVLITHHLRFWLGMAYSRGVKSYYNPDADICTCGGRCVVGWCLDNTCGGSITGSFCSRSQYQCGAILPADECVDAVHRFSVGRKPRLCACILYNSDFFQSKIFYILNPTLLIKNINFWRKQTAFPTICIELRMWVVLDWKLINFSCVFRFKFTSDKSNNLFRGSHRKSYTVPCPW